MAWGYEATFTVEHDNTLKRKIDCKDCLYYDKSDRSCSKTPRYLPEDGYNSWRNCGFFELDMDTTHYVEKKAQYDKWMVRRVTKEPNRKKSTATVKTPNVSKKIVVEKEKIGSNTSSDRKPSAIKALSWEECKKLSLTEVSSLKGISKCREIRHLQIYLDSGKALKVVIYVVEDRAYLIPTVYSAECLFQVRRLFKKKRQF